MHIVESHWARAEIVFLSIEYFRALSSPQTHSHSRIPTSRTVFLSNENSRALSSPQTHSHGRIRLQRAEPSGPSPRDPPSRTFSHPSCVNLPPSPPRNSQDLPGLPDFIGRLRPSTTTISRQEAQLFETIVTTECFGRKS